MLMHQNPLQKIKPKHKTQTWLEVEGAGWPFALARRQAAVHSGQSAAPSACLPGGKHTWPALTALPAQTGPPGD